MTRRVRALLISMFGSTLITTTCMIVDWRSAAITNQGKVIALLAHARPESAKGDHDRIQRIILAIRSS